MGHVTVWSAGQSDAKLGLMARAGLATGAPELSIVLENGSLVALKRLVAGGPTQTKTGPVYPQAPDQPDVWLKIERKDQDVILSSSNDGLAFTELDRGQPAAGSSLDVGAAATGHDAAGVRDFANGRVCTLTLKVTQPRTGFHRADPNNDGSTDLSDGVFIFNYLFLGGTTPSCLQSADANGDDAVDISDGIYILNFLFLGGPAPVPPGPPPEACAPAGVGGALSCEKYDGC
jgi:hypothetical protein